VEETCIMYVEEAGELQPDYSQKDEEMLIREITYY
jgi:hypothetical protein